MAWLTVDSELRGTEDTEPLKWEMASESKYRFSKGLAAKYLYM